MAACGPVGFAWSAEPIATLRGDTPATTAPEAPRMTRFDDRDRRRVRRYPEQPPIIPHDVEGYRIDLRSNKCLACHARSRTAESGALMISITHFECRNCRSAESMDPTRQSERAVEAHARILLTGVRTCIDRHKGIARRGPGMPSVPGWQ